MKLDGLSNYNNNKTMALFRQSRQEPRMRKER